MGFKIQKKDFERKVFLFWEHDKGYEFKPEIFNQKKTIYLQGNWLSEKYFVDIAEDVRKAFIFTKVDERNKKVFDLINNEENSVSIHIRRGDYLKSSVHLNIDYRQYLGVAIKLITQKVGSCRYFIFSDDIEFSKSFLPGLISNEDLFFIDYNSGVDSFRDMQLMSKCKHNIITNSTFSWWAAWLNDNSDKIIISPKDWFTVKEWNKNSIVPPGWITV